MDLPQLEHATQHWRKSYTSKTMTSFHNVGTCPQTHKHHRSVKKITVSSPKLFVEKIIMCAFYGHENTNVGLCVCVFVCVYGCRSFTIGSSTTSSFWLDSLCWFTRVLLDDKLILVKWKEKIPASAKEMMENPKQTQV